MAVAGLPILFAKVDVTLANASGTLSLTTDVKMTRESGLKGLKALGANDWVGAKATAKMMTASFTSHVPLNTLFEYDPSQDENIGTTGVSSNASGGAFVNISFQVGGQYLQTVGIIKSDDISDSVDGECKQVINFEGQWAPWQS